MSLTYFWLTKLFICLIYFHLTIWRRSNQLPMNDFLEVRIKSHECDLGCKLQILQTKTEVQTSNAVSFWFSPSSAGSCLLSLFLLWQKLIVSFLSSIFQGENLARTNMIDLSGKLLPCEEIETADEQIFLGKGTIAPEACLFFWYFSSCLTGLRK